MRRLGLWAVLAVAALAGSGCLSKRPYAHDPLLRGGHGQWGDQSRARKSALPRIGEPDAPRPPAPLNLPTLEWELPYLPPSGVTATVPLSCPVNTAFPSFVNTMQ